MLPSKLKSKVWSFFIRNSDASATCKLCNKKLKTTGNTSNLRCHVENVHKKVLLDQVDNAECSSKTTPHSEPTRRKISEIINMSPTAGTTASSQKYFLSRWP
ncbi:uncharacterized protein LOC120779903 [Bactrocera tryoni]|uniref:uncharacterized protein LOC120779903 n=1 Tax=Bactrocera tryoni TaxID=59916 RepID=UPI001A9666C7|nr:uncharacterized protein LOC120779903 [Bactrocera tryoni]